MPSSTFSVFKTAGNVYISVVVLTAAFVIVAPEIVKEKFHPLLSGSEMAGVADREFGVRSLTHCADRFGLFSSPAKQCRREVWHKTKSDF